MHEMRTERDFIGEISIEKDALYGIHSVRAAANFPSNDPFSEEWYRAMGTVKLACYTTLEKFSAATTEKYPQLLPELRIPKEEVITAMSRAAEEVSEGKHNAYFIVPGLQGGAGTSINLNINEIIANRALQLLGRPPGDYEIIDPIETANIFQSTNDVVPTALRVATMRLLNTLEQQVNDTRSATESLEKKYRHSLRVARTQMQEAVPSTFGTLFSTYSDALSRDWWRISKSFERIKQCNLGGGAIGTGLSIPRFFLMEVTGELRRLTGLPIAQAENMVDATCNMDSFVEVHAILKAHAVNLEKIAGDLRLLSSGSAKEREITIPDRQTGSSIMPGKVNPVIPEFVISGAHRVYSNDIQITSLAGQGSLELNAYLPSIGWHLLDSLNTLSALNRSLNEHLLDGLAVNEEVASAKLFRSPAVTTALSPLLGYHKAAQLANEMKETAADVFEANHKLGLVSDEQMKQYMEPASLLKKGFSLKDIQ